MANTGNLAFAQQQLGHSSVDTTVNNYANGAYGMKDVLSNMWFYMEMYGIMRNRGEMQMNIATYQTTTEKHGDGTFFFEGFYYSGLCSIYMYTDYNMVKSMEKQQ